MITLFIDCNKEFSAQMLLGALIDMGLSPDMMDFLLMCDKLHLNVLRSNVVVNGTEAVYACCKKKDGIKKNYAIPQTIKDLFIKEFNEADKSPECIDTICAAGLAIYGFCPDYIMCSNLMGATAADREFLSCIINEEGNPPFDEPIISVGYGAGEKDVLRVVLYGNNDDELTDEEFKEICQEHKLVY